MVRFSLLVFALLSINLGISQNAEKVGLPFDSVEFSFGDILYKGKLYTGILYANRSDGSKKASANVSNGRYMGAARTYYPSGQTHFTMRFQNGDAVGNIKVYYPNGEVKLQANLSGDAREGGSNVRNINYWVYYQSKYKQKFKGSGRVMLLTKEGLTTNRLSEMPFDRIHAFAIFDNRVKNGGRLIPNSSEMYFPF
jgi:hypothetical protein